MDNPPLLITTGCLVTLELISYLGEVEPLTITLVTDQQADLKAGLLSLRTPLGRAIFGKTAGVSVPYLVGDLRQVRILTVDPPGAPVDTSAADARRAAVEQAKAYSEITSQLIFATARGSKWGEYDVDMDKLLGDDNQRQDPPQEKES